MAFPTTSVLDSGVRADEGPPPSASWTSGFAGSATLKVVSNTLYDPTGSNGAMWGTTYGPDSECYTTITTKASDGGQSQLHLRAKEIGASTADGYRVLFTRLDANPGYQLVFRRMDNNVTTQLGATHNETGGAAANGDKVGIDMVSDTLSAYISRSGTWSSAITTRTDTTYTAAGYIGLRNNDAVAAYNDFGGGTIATASTDTPPLPNVVDFAVTRASSY